MYLTEFRSYRDESEFVLGWRYIFRYKYLNSFTFETYIEDSIFSDLLMNRVQNLERIYKFEEIEYLKKRRFDLKRNTVYKNNHHEVSLSELEEKLKEFSKDEDWGSDLKYFKKSIRYTVIIMRDFIPDNIYYFNIKNVLSPSSLRLEYNYYSYYISIVAVNTDKKEILVIDLGGD